MTTTFEPPRRPNPWEQGAVRCLDCAHARAAASTDPLRWRCAAGGHAHGRVYAPGFHCAETAPTRGDHTHGFDPSLLRPRKCPRFDNGE